MAGIILKGTDYKCLCGNKGKYLNFGGFPKKYVNAICQTCADKENKKMELKK